MKRNLIFLIVFCSILMFAQERIEKGNLVIENIPAFPARILDKVFQYQNTRGAALANWLPDNSGIIIGTRFGETSQIHYVEKPGGTRQQLTFFNEPVGGISVCPDKTKKMMLFSKDVGGGEFYQIFTFDMVNGNFKMITDGKSRNELGVWNKKGDIFAYSSTKRNNKDTDIYLSSLSNSENAELIVSEGGSWGALDFSYDGNKLLVQKYVSANETYLYYYDIPSKKLTQINPSKEIISYGGAIFNKEGTGVYFTYDFNNEFSTLNYYDLKSGKITPVVTDLKWDIEALELSNSGNLLAFTANEGGTASLNLLNTKNNKYEKVNNIPVGLIYTIRFNHDDSKLGLTFNNSKTSGDVYALDIKSKKLERWTFSETGGLNTSNFVEPKLIKFKSFDGLEIPAFYYKPNKTGKKFPVIINIHGGPEGQFTPGFSSMTQYYLNEMGIAMIAPNVRGSSGYGKTYLSMDNGYKREESVQDIGKLIEWIKQQPELDGDRICVYGGSYGGYMVLAALTHYSDQLKCGIDVVGISNFVTFLENTQDYRRDLRRVEYGDERDAKMREFMIKIAPTTNASKITKPLFIIQGLNDPRVPSSEADQILKAVKDNGVKTWYLLAKDEGHGFQKKSNRDFMTNSVIMFLEENLIK